MLSARLIGGFRLTNSRGADVTPRARKGAALLAYALIAAGAAVPRERIAALLWSEKSEAQARDSLRQCLVELRKLREVAAASAIAPRDFSILPAKIETDLQRLRTGLVRGDIAGAARLLGGAEPGLLIGLDGLDPAFDDWLVVERERWAQATIVEILEALRQGAGSRRDLVALAEAALRLDPYQEDAVRFSMESLMRDGAPAAALAFFQRYQRSLSRDYQVAPSADLLEIAGRLRSAAARPAAADERPEVVPPPVRLTPVVAEPARPLPRIAVSSAMPEPASVALIGEAFRHDLMATLARFKEWIVLGGPDDAEAPGAALDFLAGHGVDYALRASVVTGASGDEAAIALLDCDSARTLIEDRFPLGQGRWIAVLNDICCRIGARLQIVISTARLRRAALQTADELSAYDLWLEGHHLTSLWQKEAEDRAQALFERAIELDPGLACAYSSLAGILHTRHIVCPGWPAVIEDRQRAVTLARRAVELDRMDCRNHVILGWAHALALRFDSADFHFRLAVDLNPSNPDVAISAADAASLSGDREAALELAGRAFELNPVPRSFYFGYRAHVAFACGDYHGCVDDVARAGPIFPAIRMWSAMALARLGETGAAASELEACFAEVRAQWFGPPPDTAALLDYLGGVWRFRRSEDQRLIVETLAGIART